MNPALRPLIALLAEQLVDAHERARGEESRTPSFDRPLAPDQNTPHAEQDLKYVSQSPGLGGVMKSRTRHGKSFTKTEWLRHLARMFSIPVDLLRTDLAQADKVIKRARGRRASVGTRRIP